MERLSVNDATFLDLEDQVSAMHNVTAAIFEGPEPSYEAFLKRVANRVPLVPRLRQRVVGVPFNLARPVWIDDPTFSVDYHLRHTALPPGTGYAGLRVLIGRLQSQRLDRGKPLWELWMVSGLPDDRFAIVSKAHYAMIDGVSGTDPLALITDQVKNRRRKDRWNPESQPSETHLVADAARDLAFDPREQIRLTKTMVVEPLKRTARILSNRTDSDSFSGLVGAVSPHRRWHHREVKADDIRTIRDNLGVTTNDVILGLVTWGFRELLKDETDRPDSIRTLAPLAIATGDHFTNEVSSLEADLPVGAASFEEAVQNICDQTTHVVDQQKAVAGRTLADLSGLVAPTLCALGLRTATRSGVHLSDVQTVTVNAPGPRGRVSILDCTMVGLYPAIPLVSRVKISVGVMSYQDLFCFGITGDRDCELEIEAIGDGIEKAVRKSI